MQVAALEVSTSSAKAMVYDDREGVVAEEQNPFPDDVGKETAQDPDGIVDVALDTLEQVVRDHSHDIRAVGLCGTWHSLLYTDREGEPLGDIRTWVDTTGDDFVRRKRSDTNWVDAYYRKTGCLPHAMYPFWKHCYLTDEDDPQANGDALISSQIEHLFHRITGERAVSRCTASGSGFMNIHSAEWDEGLLEFASINDRNRLAPLADETKTAPMQAHVADRVGLPEGTPVTAGAADGALNQLGVGGTRTDILSFSVGTSGAIRMGVEEPELPHERSTWCYYLHDNVRVAGGATHGINCLDWYLNLLNTGSSNNEWDYASLGQRAAECDERDAPFFLPFVFGERAPGWNEDRTGVFTRMTSEHGPGDLYYAVQEGILFTLYDCYRMLVRNWDVSPQKIVISGGILNSEPWTRMAANLFGKALEHTGHTNDSTVGAAMLALKAAGGIDDVNDIDIPTHTVAEPESEKQHQTLQERYEHYREIYTKNQ